MQTINISEFRSNLLKYLEIVNKGEQITVTSNGKLLATIMPPVDQKKLAKKQLNALARVANVGDVITPTHTKWDAMS